MNVIKVTSLNLLSTFASLKDISVLFATYIPNVTKTNKNTTVSKREQNSHRYHLRHICQNFWLVLQRRSLIGRSRHASHRSNRCREDEKWALFSDSYNRKWKKKHLSFLSKTNEYRDQLLKVVIFFSPGKKTTADL